MHGGGRGVNRFCRYNAVESLLFAFRMDLFHDDITISPSYKWIFISVCEADWKLLIKKINDIQYIPYCIAASLMTVVG